MDKILAAPTPNRKVSDIQHRCKICIVRREQTYKAMGIQAIHKTKNYAKCHKGLRGHKRHQWKYIQNNIPCQKIRPIEES